MTANEAFENFNKMTLSEAFEVIVPFGKFQGKKVKELTFSYAEWVQENIQAGVASKEKFEFLYAISTFMSSPKAFPPDDYETELRHCIRTD